MTMGYRKKPDSTDVHAGQRVRIRRMMIGMSQEKLGEALGLTFQQVQKYEKGMNRMGASRLQQIANALDVPVSYFFENNGNGKAKGATGDFTIAFLSSTDGLAIAQAFLKIPEAKTRRRIADLIEALAQ